MSYYHGEYTCKLDEKSRFILPAALKKQMPEANGVYYIKYGDDGSLELIPGNVWEQRLKELEKLNQNLPKVREYIRLETEGATELVLDASSRLSPNKRMLETVGIKKEMVLTSRLNVLEIWSPEAVANRKENNTARKNELAEEIYGENRDKYIK